MNGFNEMFFYDSNASAMFSQHETAREKESARGDFKNVSKILSNVDDLLLRFFYMHIIRDCQTKFLLDVLYLFIFFK